jgi:hypothetical protein
MNGKLSFEPVQPPYGAGRMTRLHRPSRTERLAAQNATISFLRGPQVAVQSEARGPFTVPHNLGRTPIGAQINMTSPGQIYWQKPVDVDEKNLYLVAGAPHRTAKVHVW